MQGWAEKCGFVFRVFQFCIIFCALQSLHMNVNGPQQTS